MRIDLTREETGTVLGVLGYVISKDNQVGHHSPALESAWRKIHAAAKREDAKQQDK